MALYTLRSAALTVTVDSFGAQLQSIRSADGTEYLWQGDPAYWEDRAPNIFPYVARLTEGRYQLDGQIYEMAIHGFACRSEFSVEERSETALTLLLRDSAETYRQYPRRFAFRVCYALEGNRLSVTYRVENRDAAMLYFGLGGHPGFRVPLAEGQRFEDYALRFSRPCQPVRIGFTPECFVSGDDTPYPLSDGRTLPLAHTLFNDDAIVLRDTSREVTLLSGGEDHGVTVACPDMPYLGIWHRPRTDAPYVCIEPWCSLPARHGKLTVFEEQADLLRLAPGGVYENTWSITAF